MASPQERPTNGVTAYDLFVSFADADRGWVEGYLFDALDAAGITYISEAAFELGAPRVAEFERAVRASRRTLLVISPAYLTDAYAPFGDLLAQTFGLETGTWPVIPLALDEAPLPARLAMLVALDATRPEHWGRAVEQLCAALDRPVPAATPPPCPYPGMLPYREADAERFFGRDAEVAEMVERLRLHRFLAVIGASGTGKSSLVFAGALPALRRSGLFGDGGWATVVFRPGATPVDSLGIALGDRDPLAGAHSALSRSPGAERLLIVCDQFEEAFTVGREQSAAFQESLAQLARMDRCWLVVTARADFYPDLMESPLWEEIRAHRMEIAPLGAEGLRAAITHPAEAAGAHLDPALVERLLADAAGEPGALPLVQETLVLLWERIERRYLPLTAYESLAGGAARTGLQAAIARRADAALGELSPPRQAIARRVFVRLVQFGEGRADTRRQQRLSDLGAASDEAADLDATVDHLVDARLLTSTAGVEGERRIDLAHEALIAGWPTFHGWLAERREAEQARRRLEAKAAEWVRLGRGHGGLLDEVELAEAERWLAGDDANELGVDAALVDAVRASRSAIDAGRAARRRRVRAVIGGLAVGIVVVGALAVWAVLSARTARDQADRARAAEAAQLREADNARRAESTAEQRREEAEALARTALSRQLAAQAVEQLDRDLGRAMLLAVQSHRVEPTAEARSSLLTALEFSPQLLRLLPTNELAEGGTGIGTGALTFSAGGEEIVGAGSDGRLRRWDTATGAPVGDPIELVDLDDRFLPPRYEFSDDGRLLAVEDCLADTERPCLIEIWDVELGRPAGAAVELPTPYVTALAFSADNRVLAVGQITDGEHSVVLWDLAAGVPVGTPIATRAQSLAFSPDGRLLASGLAPTSNAAGESAVFVWDAATQQLLAATEEYPAGGVTALDFTADGSVLAVGHGNDIVVLLNSVDLTLYRDPLAGAFTTADLQFSPDDATLAVGSYESDRALVFSAPDWSSARELAGHQAHVDSVAFSPDGSRLVTGAADGSVALWATGDQQQLLTAEIEAQSGRVTAIAFDGAELVTAGVADDLTSRRIARSDTRSTVGLGATEDGDDAVAVSPDGRVAATGDASGTVGQIDTTTGDPLGEPITAHAGKVTALAYGADGTTLVSAGCVESDPSLFFCSDAGAEVRVWDARTGRALGGGSVPHAIARLAVSPDGGLVAISDGSSVVSLWDVAADELRGEQFVGEDRIGDIAWSPDSLRLAVTGQYGGAHAPDAGARRNNNVTVWDVTTGEPVGEPLLGHTQQVTAAALSPDGALLASGDYSGVILLWDAATLEPVGSALTTPASVETLRFSADSGTLASGHGDGVVRLWDMRIATWVELACTTAGRELDAAEWAQFVGPDVPMAPTCPTEGPG